MRYYAVNINCTPEYTEVFIALLAELGYESFEEQEYGLTAYIEERLFDEVQLVDLLNDHHGLHSGFTHELIPEKNWNEEWERNFEPVVVNEQCRIRAPFHSAEESYLYEVVIQPKMSF
ncbi:MAG TPA: 50S ribosomal protein L11 methyltransferase, partial [Bacteroidia bacterium]|nr:50S ribosomal protein L11 methyltransferase [Bacteroidia bacterium]